MSSAIENSPLNFDSIDTSRYEQFDGHLSERPRPDYRHSEAQGNLIEILGPRARQLGLRAYPALSVDREDASNSDWMTPDVVVADASPQQTKRGNALPPLLLAIEVLSPEQTIPKMIRKAERYLAWGVENVWLIEPQKQFALVIAEPVSQNKPTLVWSGSDLRLRNGLGAPLADLLA